MDKRGIEFGIGTVVTFLVIIIVAVVVIVGFRFFISNMFDFVAEQIAGVKHYWYFGTEGGTPIVRAKACEPLDEEQITILKEHYQKDYMNWIFCRAELALEGGDYDYAKGRFQEYIDGCENFDSQLKVGCSREDKLIIAQNNIKKLKVREEADKSYNSIINIANEDERVEKLKEFEKNYKDKDFFGKDELIEKAKIEIQKYSKIVLEEPEKKLTMDEAIRLLKSIDSRRNMNKESVPFKQLEEATRRLLLSADLWTTSPQLLQEIHFMTLVLGADQGICYTDQLDRILDTYKEHPEITELKYITYSYPRRENGMPAVKSSWKFIELINEAKLVLGWCYWERGEFKNAYTEALSLNAADPNGKMSSRYELYRDSILSTSQLILPCDERTNRQKTDEENRRNCHTPGSVEYNGEKFELTEEDLIKHSNLGCWWRYGYTSSLSCRSCAELKNSCKNYETGWMFSSWTEWRDECKLNPCKLNPPLSCEIRKDGWGKASCVET